ncbi:MAG: peptidylprolyl isomerase [Rheinheimera sp.]|nr:peptidylprolyl isomerase [Rheinheimera sp.]
MIEVNQQQISEADIFAEMQYHPAADKRAAMVAAAQSLIIERLICQRADELGLTKELAALQQTENNDLRQAAQDRLVQQVIDLEVTVPSATAADCELYYQQNPDKFVSSPLLEVRHILLACAPDDHQGRSNAQKQAELLLEQIQAGSAFAGLASQFSACSTKDSGGLLGQISKGQTVPELERPLFRLQPGLLPYPLESRYGLHVVEVLNRVDGKQLPYSAVSQRIADYLNEKVRRKAVAQYISVLISEAQIAGFDFQLSGSPLMQ